MSHKKQEDITFYRHHFDQFFTKVLNFRIYKFSQFLLTFKLCFKMIFLKNSLKNKQFFGRNTFIIFHIRFTVFMFLHLDNIQGGLTVGISIFLALYQWKDLFVFETITVWVYTFFTTFYSFLKKKQWRRRAFDALLSNHLLDLKS